MVQLSDPPRTSASWSALGSDVMVVVTDPDRLAAAREVLERELEMIDLACSRFREDSDCQRVTASSGRAVAVGPLCIEAVGAALRAAWLTDGAVDPALGGELILAGYDRDFSLLGGVQPPPARDDLRRAVRPAGALRAHRIPGWKTISVDRRRSTVGVGRGVRLDLGATAKALAADRAARAAEAAAGCGVLVSLGGDIAVAGAAPAGGWRVFVTDDHRSDLDAPGQMVSISTGGLATSSTSSRRWLHAGQTMHHIIDPQTGDPVAEVWRTVSVAAASCVDANIASTAAIVRGWAAEVWLAATGLPARLVAPDGAVRRLGGWPAESGSPSRPGPS